jgi:hypothetical protein
MLTRISKITLKRKRESTKIECKSSIRSFRKLASYFFSRLLPLLYNEKDIEIEWLNSHHTVYRSHWGANEKSNRVQFYPNCHNQVGE